MVKPPKFLLRGPSVMSRSLVENVEDVVFGAPRQVDAEVGVSGEREVATRKLGLPLVVGPEVAGNWYRDAGVKSPVPEPIHERLDRRRIETTDDRLDYDDPAGNALDVVESHVRLVAVVKNSENDRRVEPVSTLDLVPVVRKRCRTRRRNSKIGDVVEHQVLREADTHLPIAAAKVEEPAKNVRADESGEVVRARLVGIRRKREPTENGANDTDRPLLILHLRETVQDCSHLRVELVVGDADLAEHEDQAKVHLAVELGDFWLDALCIQPLRRFEHFRVLLAAPCGSLW